MTRINLVDPDFLPQSFLIAEYRELPRVFTLVRNLIAKGTDSPEDIQIPDTFKLGTGHVKFFYNKLDWVMQRYQRICDVLIDRGVNVDHDMIDSIMMDNIWLIDTLWGGDYKPSPEDVMLNMARLANSYYKEEVLRYKQPNIKYNVKVIMECLEE